MPGLVSIKTEGGGCTRLNPGQDGVIHRKAGDFRVKYGQCLPDGVNREIRKAVPQISRRHARLVGGDHRTEIRRRSPCEEIPDFLGGRRIIAPGSLESCLLPTALKGYPAKNIIWEVDVRFDFDDDPRIGVSFSTGILAHPIRRHRPPAPLSDVAATTVSPGHIQKE